MRVHLAENLQNTMFIDMLKDYPYLLFSYASRTKNWEKIFEKVKARAVLLDSGAFSVWTKGRTIDREEYLKFAKYFKTVCKCEVNVVNLDVIPGEFGRKPTKSEIEESAQKSWDNMLFFEANGLKVINVFHQHEDFKWLERLAEHSDYIGISPANDVTKAQRIVWLDKVYSRIRDTRKTHGFGATAKDIIYRYPWFSVDSTSWKSPLRFGSSITTNLEKRGIGKSLGKRPTSLMKKECFDEIARWKQLNLNATRLWETRGISWGE